MGQVESLGDSSTLFSHLVYTGWRLSLTRAEPRFIPPGMCSIPSVLPVPSLLPSPPHTGTFWALSPGAARHFLSQLDPL